MRPVVTAAEMCALDRATIDVVGLPVGTLMETAGRAVADAAVRMLGEVRGHVAVLCGPGNNGGDGFVVARVLRHRGLDAVAYLAVPREAVSVDARMHLEILERAGGVVRSLSAPEELRDLGDQISSAVLVIDALFGVGLARPITGHLAAIVDRINQSPRRLAVDIPSGLDADTGRALGAVVSAQRTVTMGALKLALVTAPGFVCCGDLEVAEIGIPPSLVAAANLGAGLVEEADVRGWLPRPNPLDHKGRRGHALVIGVDVGMRGAGRLAATAALRAGAGLVTLATETGDAGAPDSVITRTIDAALSNDLDDKDVIVIGCGLGTSEVSAAHVARVLASGIPAVLDADALNVLASAPAAIAGSAGPIVITPHPGEAARLLATTAAAIEADRIASARKLAAITRAVVVLKGARTVVCDGTIGSGYASINPNGGPSLATAGSGDVLAGTIGGLIAQGVAVGDAARAAVFVHGLAGDRLASVLGARGVISSDLPAAIAFAIRGF